MLCETFAVDHREQRIRRNRSIESGRISLWFHQQQYRATAQASVAASDVAMQILEVLEERC
jgi:hypothetical protein